MTRPSRYAPDTISAPPTWHQHALCTPDPEAMFPDHDAVKITHAVRICRKCPVRHECLVDSLRTHDVDHGIRAGLLPEERRMLLDRQFLRRDT